MMNAQPFKLHRPLLVAKGTTYRHFELLGRFGMLIPTAVGASVALMSFILRKSLRPLVDYLYRSVSSVLRTT